MLRLAACALGALVACAALALESARAHGTIAPAAAVAGSQQRFELTVPGDRPDADVVAVAVRLPPGAQLESAEAKQPLWSVSSDGSLVTWRGGPIARGSAETFAFTARMPADPGSVELTLLESYDDGDAPPFPIAVSLTDAGGGSGGASDAVAVLALVVAALALAVATAALALALRAHRSPPAT